MIAKLGCSGVLGIISSVTSSLFGGKQYNQVESAKITGLDSKPERRKIYRGIVRTPYGLAVVLDGPILFGFPNTEGYRLRLTENSWCPGKEILYYPTSMIKEVEDDSPDAA